MPQHPGQPDVGETHVADGTERGVVDVREAAHAFFGQRPVLLERLVGIAKEPDEELVNANSGFGRTVAAAEGETRRLLPFEPKFVVMRNVFVAAAGIDRLVGATPKPTPAVIRARILGEDCKID